MEKAGLVSDCMWRRHERESPEGSIGSGWIGMRVDRVLERTFALVSNLQVASFSSPSVTGIGSMN